MSHQQETKRTTFMKWLEIRLNSKMTKVGHKVRTFEELVKLNPQFILDAMAKDNRILLLEECCVALSNETKNLRTIKIILERNAYRRERFEEEQKIKIEYTDSDDILMGSRYTIYNNYISGIRYGI